MSDTRDLESYPLSDLDQIVVSRHWCLFWKAHYCMGGVIQWTKTGLTRSHAIGRAFLPWRERNRERA